MVMPGIVDVIEESHEQFQRQKVADLLDPLIQPEQYVGEVLSLSYDEAIVQVHDHHRQQVGGLPSQCFLVATAKQRGPTLDWNDEDACVILLRVQGPASLPHDSEAFRIKTQAAQRSAEEQGSWRDEIDLYTRNMLSFAGLRCRVLGTFYVDQDEDGSLRLRFGADISNYYAAYALKVYKPVGEALDIIVNYRDPNRLADHPLREERVTVGRVRYASADRKGQGIDTVRVHLYPTDLLRQKTALFGMTRTGKSNTTKIIARSIFELRYRDAVNGRVGQLIFDYNGEYANENVQDRGALRNVWRAHPNGKQEDVVTYGSLPHSNDRNRRLLKINFYLDDMLPIGKQILNDLLAEEKVRYVEAFRNASLEPPGPGADPGTFKRYKRRCLAYRALLYKAGYRLPSSFQRPDGRRLFNSDLLKAMRSSNHEERDKFAQAADTLEKVSSGNDVSWDELASALITLHAFITGKNTGYDEFNEKYREESSSGLEWAEQDLKGILGMLAQANGPVLVGRGKQWHTHTVDDDFVKLIYDDLKAGRLVIIDQSLGDPQYNRQTADRIMAYVFREQQRIFSEGKTPPDIVVYVEEAHNLLPSGKELDPDDPRAIWPRVAKEGAKLHIGLIYATQEVSSIHKSVLKNTANWFIGHLNNTEETRELVKFYDFSDYEPSILRVQDPGFLRVKTLSNSYIVPVQIDRFRVEVSEKSTSSHADQEA